MIHYILDALFLAFGVITVILCAKRGFFLTLLKCFKLLLSVLAAYFFGSQFGAFLGEAFLNKPIRNSVFNKVNDIYLNTAGAFNAENAMEAIPSFLINEELQEKIRALEGSGDALVNSITDTISNSLSAVVCSILGYVLMFAIAFAVLSLVYLLVKGLRSKVKLLGLADTALGGLLGLIWACIILLLVGSLLKFFLGEQDAYTQSVIVKFFGESSILDAIGFLNIHEWLSKLQNAG